MNRITDLVVGITCIVLLAIVVSNHFQSTVELSAAENPIEVGTPFETPQGEERWERSVMLVLHSQCRYCTESMDLYRELTRRAAEAGNHGRTFRLSIRGPEPVPVLQSYLSSHGISGIHVESLRDLGALKRNALAAGLGQKGDGCCELDWKAGQAAGGTAMARP